MDRRIAAIFVADMVGSTRLMERDERDVITRHKAHLAEVFEPEFATRRGRVIKGTGDGLLGVFDSVVDALECALSIQREMATREADGPEDRRIQYRIGVNLGDVIFSDDDVHGDGVNVAARLEGLAEPGGVVVSGHAHDLLKSQVSVGYQALKAVRVKNVSEPVRAFRVLDDPDVVGEVARKTPIRWLVAAAMLIAAGLAGGWFATQPDFERAEPEKMAYRLPDQPSIAVLPFENLANDPEHNYLGRSLTEQIVMQLTTSPSLVVVEVAALETAKNGSYIKEVAEAGGVRHVLIGSYLLQGEGLQVTARLVDAVSGHQVWAETFVRKLTAENFFELQKVITQKIAIETNSEVNLGDLDRSHVEPAASIEDMQIAYEAIGAFEQWSSAGNARSGDLYVGLLQKYPDSAPFNAMVAWVNFQKVLIGAAKPAEAFPIVQKHALHALETNPRFPGAHAVLAWVALMSRDFETAESYINDHIRYSDGHPSPSILGALLALDRLKEAEDIARQVMREQLKHFDSVPRNLGRSLLMQRRYDDARYYLEGILNSETQNTRLKPQVMRDLVVLSHLQNDDENRQKYLVQLLAAAPGVTLGTVAKGFGYYRSRDWPDKYLGALREAGIPEG